MDDTYVYFFTYDQIFQIYDFSGDEIKCVILDRTISIIDQLEPEFLKDIRVHKIIFRKNCLNCQTLQKKLAYKILEEAVILQKLQIL